MTQVTIRPGSPDDIPVVLSMLDSSVAWLAAQGRTGQWGTRPWSASPAGVRSVEEYLTTGSPWIAELDGTPAATLTLTDGPGSYLDHLEPVGEPERYVHLLASDRRFAGRGAGAALLAHAATETRAAGVHLLRVDCYAGDDRKLVAYYESNGFRATQAFTIGDDKWPGQVLQRRV